MLHLFLSFFCLFSFKALASSLSYSGRLVNTNGSPVTGTVNLQFDLSYSDSPSAVICSQTQSNVPLSQGVFHVELSFSNSCLSSQTLDQVIGAIPVNETLTIRVSDLSHAKVYPLQAIHSVPQSIYANVAKTIDQMGATNGQYLKWDGSKWAPSNLGAGAGSVTEINTGAGLSGGPITSTGTISIADGGVTDAKIASGITRTKLSNGTPNYVLVNNGSGALSEVASLPVAQGGTGASSASVALANLGGAPSVGAVCDPAFQKLHWYVGVGWGCANDTSADSLPSSGGTMSGNINMGGNSITNLATPSGAQDAATKNYVDTQINSNSVWTVNGGDVYRSSGNVGIGTNTPDNPLTVNLPAVGSNSYVKISPAGTGFATRFGNTATNQAAWFTNLFYTGSTWSKDNLSYGGWRMNQVVGSGADNTNTFNLDYAPMNQTNPNSLFSVTGTGNVGIGTTTPDTTQGKVLHLANTLNDGTVNSNSTLILESNRNSHIVTVAPATSNSALYFRNTSVATSTGSGRVQYDHNLKELSLWTDNTKRFLIDSSGNVGLGSTTPQAKLDLGQGDVRFVDQNNSSISYNLKSANISGDDRLIINSTGTPNGSRLWLDSPSGTNPGFSLAANSSEQFYFGGLGSNAYGGITYQGNDFLISTGAGAPGTQSTKMIVKNGGNVGIGVLNPGEKLEVAGKVKATELCIGSDCKAAWPTTATPVDDSVTSAKILDGTIVNADINASANIAQTKIANLATDLAGKEPVVTAGTTTQYYRGDKTWQSFTDSVLSSVLTGYTTGAALPLSATDTVLQGLGKLEGSLATLQSSSWTSSSGNIYRSSGNVGIGTNNPSANLHVNGSAKLGSQINMRSKDNGVFNGTGQFLIYNETFNSGTSLLLNGYHGSVASGYHSLQFASNAGAASTSTANVFGEIKGIIGDNNPATNDKGGDLAFSVGAVNSGGVVSNFQEAMRINALNHSVSIGTTYAGTSAAPTNGLIVEGKVGIGNTSPTVPLSIGPNPVAAFNSGELLQLGRTNDAYMTISDGTGRFLLGTTSGLPFIGTQNATDFTLRTNNSERVRLTSGGYLGIGSTNPGAPLEVSNSSSATYLPVANFYAPNNTTPGNASQFRFGQAGSTGNSAEWRFVYQGSDSNSNRVDFGFWGYVAPVLTYLKGGNVGIGVTNPSEKLEVSGKVKATELCIGSDCKAAWPTTATPIDDSVTSAKILDGSIVNADINASANIAQSKIANLTTDLAAKEPLIATGTAIQYIDGTKSLQNFTSSVINSVLTGYTTGAALPLSATDTVLQGLGKLEGSIASLQSSSWTANSGNIYRTSGNVGIGTTSPTANLDVYGLSSIGNRAVVGNTTPSVALGFGYVFQASNNSFTTPSIGSAQIIVENFAGNGGAAGIGFKQSDAYGNGHGVKTGIFGTGPGGYGKSDLSFALNSANNSSDVDPVNDAKMIIKSSGNVGIGTNNPTALLSLGGDRGTSIWMDSGAGRYGSIEMGNTNGVMTLTTSTDFNSLTQSSFIFNQLGSGSRPLLDIQRSGSSQFLITNDGSVGVGTTNPTENLSVNGSFSTGKYRIYSTRLSITDGQGDWTTIGTFPSSDNNRVAFEVDIANPGSLTRRFVYFGNYDTPANGNTSFYELPANFDAGIRYNNDVVVDLAVNAGLNTLRLRRKNAGWAFGNDQIDVVVKITYGGALTPVTSSGSGASVAGVFWGTPLVQNSSKVGIGISNPVAALDVNGEVKFGNTSSTCNATNEGQQRYNSSTKVMEFCNGTAWTVVGSSGRTSCPSGFTLIGTSGTSEAFCISTNEETSATWLSAVTTCSNKSPAARLCSTSEWAHACVKAGTYGVNNMTGNYEWVADTNSGSGGIMGNTACDTMSANSVASSYASRCCFR